MVSMDTAPYHDYTGKIFIQRKIPAYDGWCMAEQKEHANLQKDVAIAAAASALAWVRKKQAGSQAGQATNDSLI